VSGRGKYVISARSRMNSSGCSRPIRRASSAPRSRSGAQLTICLSGALRLRLRSESGTHAFREQTWSARRITMEELRVVTPRAQRDEPDVGRERFEYPHCTLLYGRRPPARGEAGVFLIRDSVSTHSLQRRNRSFSVKGFPAVSAASRRAPPGASSPPRNRSGRHTLRPPWAEVVTCEAGLAS
jgi:hypothetical protein